MEALSFAIAGGGRQKLYHQNDERATITQIFH